MVTLAALKSSAARAPLHTATIRDFSGGYNVLDNDLNLSTKFSTKMFNVYHTASSDVKVRYGTSLFSNLRNATSTISGYCVNIEYYNSAIIAVMSNGEIISVLADRTTTRIWDATIAAALPGAPAGWSATTFASFAQFNGDLIICNGVDKPLIINTSLSVDYLQDLATSSNLNVPICRYVAVHDRFLCMAGDPLFPNRLHISSRDTSGTWYGDPAPNDGTFIDVGSSLKNASVITGIANFRSNLIISFPEGVIIAELGIYDSTGLVHTPNVDQTVEQYGSISHRALLNYGDDMLMMDGVGVPSLKRTVFTGTIRPDRVSDLVDPEMSQHMETLSIISLEERCFSVYDQRESLFMFFIPNTDDIMTTTETTCYAFLFRPNLGASSWARFDDWNWTCGCRTQQGNVFFGDVDGKLWIYGSRSAPLYSDKLNDSTINNGDGISIDFDWELPWTYMKDRTKKKKSKYIALDTTGTGPFTVRMYVDQFLVDGDDVDAPLLIMEMVGGGVIGYGGPFSPYGGGRITADEHLYAWPADFKLMKLRISGTSDTQLEFVSISLHYLKGGLYR